MNVAPGRGVPLMCAEYVPGRGVPLMCAEDVPRRDVSLMCAEYVPGRGVPLMCAEGVIFLCDQLSYMAVRINQKEINVHVHSR